ncbi:MAG: hypothetical protein Q4A21_00825 [bacterium]|nr:hypothetical protein [bacterium]
MKNKKSVKIINFKDPILEQTYKIRIEKIGRTALRVALPVEKSFFRGVEFEEKVELKRDAKGGWKKHLRAKFGQGAEELFGLTSLDEDSDLEARDIRIIAAVEKAVL